MKSIHGLIVYINNIVLFPTKVNRKINPIKMYVTIYYGMLVYIIIKINKFIHWPTGKAVRFDTVQSTII